MMEKLIIIFAIYVLCGFFCLIQLFFTKRQIENILSFFVEENKMISFSFEKKAKRIIGIIALTPLLNFVIGLYLTVADPMKILQKINEKIT